MRTIVVDDEPWAIRNFQRQCDSLQSLDIVGSFTNPVEALEFSKHNQVDFAVLDIDMPLMNGLELGIQLRSLYPDVVLVYVTAYNQYANAALQQKADYSLTKPCSPEDIIDVVSRAQLLSMRQRKPVFIRTFGNFDVFLNGQAIFFPSAKAKELLAFLVHNKGGIVTTAEAMATVWDGDGSNALCRTAAMRLRKTLESNGISYILSNKGEDRFVDIRQFDCDYYLFLHGIKVVEWAFTGEYMSQYSWAEATLSTLLKKTDLI